MDEGKGFREDYVSQEVVIGRVRLTIIAEKISESNWSLSVRNELGVASNWWEFFPTAQEAIFRALETINEEGVAEFMGYEDFGYLYDNENV